MTIAENPSIAKRGTVRLTTAQALVRYLSGLRTRVEGPGGDEVVPLFGGVFAIFGHGNVAGLGEALYQYRDKLPTYRAHNEQAMANASIAYASALRRRTMTIDFHGPEPPIFSYPRWRINRSGSIASRGYLYF
jgi:3D-(3,5/4)-trihydroxycyclohexane-1,2-dione acylhydrolase (decyclizing)